MLTRKNLILDSTNRAGIMKDPDNRDEIFEHSEIKHDER